MLNLSQHSFVERVIYLVCLTVIVGNRVKQREADSKVYLLILLWTSVGNITQLRHFIFIASCWNRVIQSCFSLLVIVYIQEVNIVDFLRDSVTHLYRAQYLFVLLAKLSKKVKESNCITVVCGTCLISLIMLCETSILWYIPDLDLLCYVKVVGRK